MQHVWQRWQLNFKYLLKFIVLEISRRMNLRLFLAKQAFVGFSKNSNYQKNGLKFYQIPLLSPFLTTA